MVGAIASSPVDPPVAVNVEVCPHPMSSVATCLIASVDSDVLARVHVIVLVAWTGAAIVPYSAPIDVHGILDVASEVCTLRIVVPHSVSIVPVRELVLGPPGCAPIRSAALLDPGITCVVVRTRRDWK